MNLSPLLHYANPAHLLVSGIIVIVVGILSYIGKKIRLKNWIHTVGVVENFRRGPNGNVTVYVRYSDQTNTKHACTLPVADDNSVSLGSDIALAYNPALPTEVFIADKKDINTFAMMSVMFGVALIAGSVLSAVITPHLHRY